MPVYCFACDCGQHSETYYPQDAPEHTKILRCPGCGANMFRDYRSEKVGIGGDLPSRWDYYDPGLGTNITSKSDRDRQMRAQGLQEYDPDPEMSRYRNEMRYIKKNASPKERAVAKAKINELGKQAGKRRKSRIIRDELAKVKV